MFGPEKRIKFVILTNQYLQAMKTVKEKENYQTPGKPMTQAEFEAHVNKAEKGPFTDWEEGKKEFEVWKKTVKK